MAAMDSSISNCEIMKSTVEIDTKPSSEKSDNIEGNDDTSSRGSLTASLKGSSTDSLNNDCEDDFDNNLPETVSILTHPETGAKIYLVGTVHVSEKSKEDVVKVIRAVQPHIVILELCIERAFEESKNISFKTIVNTILRNGVHYGVTYLLFMNLYEHITRETGIAAGGEFQVAFMEAQKIPNCKVLFGDRSIKVTLLRALASLSWFQSIKVAWDLLFPKFTITKKDVEEIKKQDIFESLLDNFSSEYPTLREVIFNERDIYLTSYLQEVARVDVTKLPDVILNDSTKRIVAVVGIGHTPGIKKLFFNNQSQFVQQLLVIPPQPLTSKLIMMGIKLSILSLGGVLVYKCLQLLVSKASNDSYQVSMSRIKAALVSLPKVFSRFEET